MAAAQKQETTLYYRVPEDTFDRLKMVRDSMKLLMNCADGAREAIEPQLLASHLELLLEQVNAVIKEADWVGRRV